DDEAVVSPIAKVRRQQHGELAVDRQEDHPRPVSPAAIEMLPSRYARQSRHELGRSLQEIIHAQVSPEPSEQTQADEYAPLGARQPEERREVIKKLGVPGPDVPLNSGAATKELEPPRVHVARHLVAPGTSPRVFDEPLRAVEPPSIALGEMPSEVVLDRRCE